MEPWLVVLVLGQLAFASFIIWILARHREGRMRQRSEERARLLERFSSGQEVADFLNSPSGARYLSQLSGKPPHPAKSLSATVTAGILSIFAGSAFMILTRLIPGFDFRVPGVLGLMVGAGILISAAVSAWLYRRAGLLPAKSQDGASEDL